MKISSPLTIACLLLFLPIYAFGHGVAESDAVFIETIRGVAIMEFMYLGAKHMVTGYDHILFITGVLYFLYRLKDVAVYVSLFTLGHSITLLAGVLEGINANPYIVDAIIGCSIVYKAFDNMGGFGRMLSFRPNVKVAVAIFGLFHGLGLATKLQDFTLSSEGLIINMISFNIGVELGQVLVLTFLLLIFTYWRTKPYFIRHAYFANSALMFGGFLLIGYQMVGYFIG